VIWLHFTTDVLEKPSIIRVGPV